MFSKDKKSSKKLKLVFLFVLAVFWLLIIFSPTTKILAAEGGCVCNNAGTCPSQTLIGATMIAAQNRCDTYCTTDCAGGGVSAFTPYWPCRCCDGTDLGTRSDSGCRLECASHSGTGLSGDPLSIPLSDCTGRFTSTPETTPPTSRLPGCYCSGTLVRAMSCSTFSDCQTVCPAGTAVTEIMCVLGYSESPTSRGGTSGGPSPENNSLCWRQSQCINSCPVAGGCAWEDPSNYPPCASSTGDWGRCIPTNAEPVTLQIPIIGVTQIANIADYIALIYKYIVSVGGILAGIMIMIGGLLYLTAGGSPERVGNAKSYIGNALIGLVLLLTSYVVLQTINPQLVQFSRFTIPLIRPARLPARFCNEFPAPLPTQPPLKFARATATGSAEIKPLAEIRDVDYSITNTSEMRCGTPFYEQASGAQTCLGMSCQLTRAPSGKPGACVPANDAQTAWNCMNVAIAGKIKISGRPPENIVIIGPGGYITDPAEKLWPDFYYIPTTELRSESLLSIFVPSAATTSETGRASQGIALSFGDNIEFFRAIFRFVTRTATEHDWRWAGASHCLNIRSIPADQYLGIGTFFSPNILPSYGTGPVICDLDFDNLPPVSR